MWRVVVCDLETSTEEAKSPLKGCEYKPTMGCDAERKIKEKNTTERPQTRARFGDVFALTFRPKN
jgi:hypothetical protein